MINKMLSQMKQLSADERAALYEAMKQEVAKNTRVVDKQCQQKKKAAEILAYGSDFP